MQTRPKKEKISIGQKQLALRNKLWPSIKLNPMVVEVMQEIGMDISRNRTKAVSDMLESGKSFAYVVTVCDEASAERCPIFPGIATRLHWSFADPSAFEGSHEEKLAHSREIRDAIKAKVEAWCAEVCSAVAG